MIKGVSIIGRLLLQMQKEMEKVDYKSGLESTGDSADVKPANWHVSKKGHVKGNSSQKKNDRRIADAPVAKSGNALSLSDTGKGAKTGSPAESSHETSLGIFPSASDFKGSIKQPSISNKNNNKNKNKEQYAIRKLNNKKENKKGWGDMMEGYSEHMEHLFDTGALDRPHQVHMHSDALPKNEKLDSSVTTTLKKEYIKNYLALGTKPDVHLIENHTNLEQQFNDLSMKTPTIAHLVMKNYGPNGMSATQFKNAAISIGKEIGNVGEGFEIMKDWTKAMRDVENERAMLSLEESGVHDAVKPPNNDSLNAVKPKENFKVPMRVREYQKSEFLNKTSMGGSGGGGGGAGVSGGSQGGSCKPIETQPPDKLMTYMISDMFLPVADRPLKGVHWVDALNQVYNCVYSKAHVTNETVYLINPPLGVLESLNNMDCYFYETFSNVAPRDIDRVGRWLVDNDILTLDPRATMFPSVEGCEFKERLENLGIDMNSVKSKLSSRGSIDSFKDEEKLEEISERIMNQDFTNGYIPPVLPFDSLLPQDEMSYHSSHYANDDLTSDSSNYANDYYVPLLDDGSAATVLSDSFVEKIAKWQELCKYDLSKGLPVPLKKQKLIAVFVPGGCPFVLDPHKFVELSGPHEPLDLSMGVFWDTVDRRCSHKEWFEYPINECRDFYFVYDRFGGAAGTPGSMGETTWFNVTQVSEGRMHPLESDIITAMLKNGQIVSFRLGDSLDWAVSTGPTWFGSEEPFAGHFRWHWTPSSVPRSVFTEFVGLKKIYNSAIAADHVGYRGWIAYFKGFLSDRHSVEASRVAFIVNDWALKGLDYLSKSAATGTFLKGERGHINTLALSDQRYTSLFRLNDTLALKLVHDTESYVFNKRLEMDCKTYKHMLYSNNIAKGYNVFFTEYGNVTMTFEYMMLRIGATLLGLFLLAMAVLYLVNNWPVLVHYEGSVVRRLSDSGADDRYWLIFAVIVVIFLVVKFWYDNTYPKVDPTITEYETAMNQGSCFASQGLRVARNRDGRAIRLRRRNNYELKMLKPSRGGLKIGIDQEGLIHESKEPLLGEGGEILAESQLWFGSPDIVDESEEYYNKVGGLLSNFSVVGTKNGAIAATLNGFIVEPPMDNLPQARAWRDLQVDLSKYVEPADEIVMTEQKVIDWIESHDDVGKKRLYMKAFQHNRNIRDKKEIPMAECFPKSDESLHNSKVKPRPIINMSPNVAVVLGPYVKEATKHLKEAFGSDFAKRETLTVKSPFGDLACHLFFCPGMNFVELGHMMDFFADLPPGAMAMGAAGDDCVAVFRYPMDHPSCGKVIIYETDFSAYDASQGEAELEDGVKYGPLAHSKKMLSRCGFPKDMLEFFESAHKGVLMSYYKKRSARVVLDTTENSLFLTGSGATTFNNTVNNLATLPNFFEWWEGDGILTDRLVTHLASLGLKTKIRVVECLEDLTFLKGRFILQSYKISKVPFHGYVWHPDAGVACKFGICKRQSTTELFPSTKTKTITQSEADDMFLYCVAQGWSAYPPTPVLKALILRYGVKPVALTDDMYAKAKRVLGAEWAFKPTNVEGFESGEISVSQYDAMYRWYDITAQEVEVLERAILCLGKGEFVASETVQKLELLYT